MAAVSDEERRAGSGGRETWPGRQVTPSLGKDQLRPPPGQYGSLPASSSPTAASPAHWEKVQVRTGL
eukprot:2064313-Rhodomonas_salina.1